MLLQKDPGKWDDFPCYLVDLQFSQMNLAGVLQPPRRGRFSDFALYMFVMGGYLWFFEVGKSHSRAAEGFAIRDNGDFKLAVGDGTTLLKSYQRMFKKVSGSTFWAGSVILTG
jgi:hypothetical protein